MEAATVVIVGGGPGGTAAALELKQKGIDALLLEKESFPRFHIGESMTGECGGSVRALGLEHKMAAMRFPIKTGTITYGKGGKNSFFIPVMGRDQHGELFPQTTWQVRRSDFDKMMLDAVREREVPVVSGQALDVLRSPGGEVCGIKARLSSGQSVDIGAQVVVDASGQATFLHAIGVAGPKEKGHYHKQLAIYAHFTGAVRLEEGNPDDTLLFYQKKNHWAWFIPIDDKVTSIGVSVPSDYFKECQEDRQDFLMREMRELNPQLAQRVTEVQMVSAVHTSANYSYQIRDFTGRGFLCVGDAHRFIDPIFSLGMHFGLAEGRMAADAIESFLNGQTANAENPFLEYQQQCEAAQDIIQGLLDGFWDYPTAFLLHVRDPRYRPNFIDMFAGRVYNGEQPIALQALRQATSHRGR